MESTEGSRSCASMPTRVLPAQCPAKQAAQSTRKCEFGVQASLAYKWLVKLDVSAVPVCLYMDAERMAHRCPDPLPLIPIVVRCYAVAKPRQDEHRSVHREPDVSALWAREHWSTLASAETGFAEQSLQPHGVGDITMRTTALRSRL